MLKKIIAVSIISLLGFNTPLHAETSIPVSSNTGFFSKAMQKGNETRFIFSLGGGFDYLTKSKFSTSQLRYVTVPHGTTDEENIKKAIEGDWAEGPYAAYPTRYRYQAYPEIELGLRYMPKDKYYIQVTGNWQFMDKKLQFANINKAHFIDTNGVGAEFKQYTADFIAAHPEIRDDINPLMKYVIGYVDGADECKVVKLKSRGNINFSAGKFLNKTLCVGVDFGVSIHDFSINGSDKSAIGFIAGVNFEHFFNSRISLVAYTNYEFSTKKIEGARSIVRGLNFGGRIRCHF